MRCDAIQFHNVSHTPCTYVEQKQCNILAFNIFLVAQLYCMY